jgi:hypothetical protein
VKQHRRSEDRSKVKKENREMLSISRSNVRALVVVYLLRLLSSIWLRQCVEPILDEMDDVFGQMEDDPS